MKLRSLIFKTLISAALLIYLVFNIKIGRLMLVVRETNYLLLLYTIPFIVLIYVIRALKWKIILKAVNEKVSLLKSLKIVLMGTFYGMLTPAKAGELARVYFLDSKKSKTLPTVIIDKMVDIFTLVILSTLIILLLFKDIYLFYVTLGIAVVVTLALFFFMNKKLLNMLANMFGLPDYAADVYLKSMTSIIKNSMTLILSFILSGMYYGTCFIIGALALRAIESTMDLKLVLSLPLIILFGNAPITISGLGLREFVAVVTFGSLNQTSSTGFIFSFLLFLAITFVPGVLGFLMNITLKEKIIKLKNIPGNYFSKHKSKNPAVKFLMDNFHKDVDKFVKKAKAKNILDVGCGEGYTTTYVKENNKVKIRGIDIEPSIVQKARALHPDIKFDVGDAHKIKSKSSNFDLIIANEVLEHVKSPEKVLKEVKRVSKKYCILSVPNEPYWRMANMARFAYLSDLGNTPGHIHHWTKRGFRKLLKKHFKKVTVKNSYLWNIALCEK